MNVFHLDTTRMCSNRPKQSFKQDSINVGSWLTTNSIKRGSVIAEAAIVFPIFLLAMATILGLISEAYREAKLYKELCESACEDMTYVFDISSEIPFMIKLGSTDDGSVSRILYYRPFYGSAEEEETIVYVYPKRGEKYHYKDCSTLDNNKDFKVMKLPDAIEAGYSECKLCGRGGTDYFK